MKTDAVHAIPSIEDAYGGQIDEEDRWKEDNAVFGLERAVNIHIILTNVTFL